MEGEGSVGGVAWWREERVGERRMIPGRVGGRVGIGGRRTCAQKVETEI